MLLGIDLTLVLFRKFLSLAGKFFVSILDFTRAGSKFLFEGLVVGHGYLWIYFCHFRSCRPLSSFLHLPQFLFYLGIIQKVVQALAWLLTKTLGISGAESLSVTGNIFLGQTEAPY